MSVCNSIISEGACDDESWAIGELEACTMKVKVGGGDVAGRRYHG